MSDLVFVRLTNVDDFYPQLRIAQGPLHLLNADFIGIRTGSDWLGGNGAKLFVVNELGDGRGLAAEWALGITAQFEFAKFHVEGVEQEQPANQGAAFA